MIRHRRLHHVTGPRFGFFRGCLLRPFRSVLGDGTPDVCDTGWTQSGRGASISLFGPAKAAIMLQLTSKLQGNSSDPCQAIGATNTMRPSQHGRKQQQLYAVSFVQGPLWRLFVIATLTLASKHHKSIGTRLNIRCMQYGARWIAMRS